MVNCSGKEAGLLSFDKRVQGEAGKMENNIYQATSRSYWIKVYSEIPAAKYSNLPESLGYSHSDLAKSLDFSLGGIVESLDFLQGVV